jgi:hypothetical protein
MLYIVTVKYTQAPKHDPKNKKTGSCQVSDVCDDYTGAHHSFLAQGDTAGEVRAAFEARWHVTRVESATFIDPFH